MSVKLTAVSFNYRVRSIASGPWYRNLFSRTETTVNIFQALDLHLPHSGTNYGLLGKNGSGKTTLIKLMSGILQADSGSIDVFGDSPSTRKPGMLRQLGVMFGHQSLLWPELSLHENLRLFEHIYRRHYDPAQVDIRLQELALCHIVDKPAKTYSLGQSVKANLLIHLLNQPRLLILDEPTIGLDIESGIALRPSLAQFAQQTGAIVLITSHNMADIAEICEQVFFLVQGRIRAIELNPKHGKHEKIIHLESLFL
ncbi:MULTISPECIES: ATP-binding cassette domain-containing protein [unclassified Undibacterium]|uniref:ATP-binding cassette domain-containing protein n=1 Tax=unclassified Undibacterium TaxID=2630295 RepID=UPI002AC9B957|nr:MULTISPECIES: ATP-binding cassette domain-containing protein [unclassified Undibacterium]MEB0138105.1 ATP-binding cassette domain-containing protein [Undibacterium sp. CCC2.1]MEB0171140.1 ATP-binding cassette domain-containing protein [Undibacterium sp. CCC1.1]MEB0175185.1 ATP-binding cassette domain-containing protein [Undibacterium sp. CCC3.4]MEB0214231.1 ATP-binding cassette domain-containing protein [Undibacterium sp. 5I2]WPX41813.1 ATP-binding cassette domain-containing protein [Undiba